MSKIKKASRLRLVPGMPLSTENGKVRPPRRRKNADTRAREHLTHEEVKRLIAAAGRLGRHGDRDATLLLLAYRHGFRVGELANEVYQPTASRPEGGESRPLRWEQVDFANRALHVNRLKHGVPSTHELDRVELNALHRLRKKYPDSPYVFCSERGGPMTASNVRKLVARAGAAAGLEFTVHPHMLRHACGYHLANKGRDTRGIQGYLGHRNIQHTVRYTELAPGRFKGFWED